MCKFIRLSNAAINISKISLIHIKKEAFIIHMSEVNHGGFMFVGCGGFDSSPLLYEVSKAKSHCDFIKISEFLDKNSI